MIKNRLFAAIFILSSSFGFAQDSLKIMTWNVFMRPSILNDGQLDRIDSTAAFLKASDADIIVLQELFHRRARKRLIKSLEATYPYYTSRGPKSEFNVASGVAILSKYPIESETHVPFKRATGSDRLARKGVIKAKVKTNKGELFVLGTHLQAGEGNKRKGVRKRQLETLAEVSESLPEDANVLIAGDFNIDASSEVFEEAMTLLDTDFKQPEGDECFTSNFDDQELFATDGKPKWIDFVFLRRNRGSKLLSAKIETPRYLSKGKLKRLSDHSAFINWIKFESKREISR